MSNAKVVWLINQYASTPETGMGGRHYSLAKDMAAKGITVFLVAASYTHLHRNSPEIHNDFYLEKIEGINFVWVKVRSYPDAHSKTRILNWFAFAWKLKRLAGFIQESPDAILCSSPSLISFLGANALGRKYGARLVFEVRDIWPLSLVELGGFSIKHPFIRFLQWIEDMAYVNADKVVSNLKYSVEHMVQRGMNRDKFTWIPNGFSLSEVANEEALDVRVASELPKEKFIVGYTGTVGVANALDNLIYAANLLSDMPDIAFVIVGGGKEKAKLEQLTSQLNLSNVHFIDPIPKRQIQSMLAEFDICYIGLTRDPLFRFGVSPNKLFDYFYAAKPVLYAIESGDYHPVADVDAGIEVPAEDKYALVNGIKKLYSLSDVDRQLMGERGRRLALDEHEYSVLSDKLIEVLVK